MNRKEKFVFLKMIEPHFSNRWMFDRIIGQYWGSEYFPGWKGKIYRYHDFLDDMFEYFSKEYLEKGDYEGFLYPYGYIGSHFRNKIIPKNLLSDVREAMNKDPLLTRDPRIEWAKAEHEAWVKTLN